LLSFLAVDDEEEEDEKEEENESEEAVEEDRSRCGYILLIRQRHCFVLKNISLVVTSNIGRRMMPIIY
jgi:hypothetical protein